MARKNHCFLFMKIRAFEKKDIPSLLGLLQSNTPQYFAPEEAVGFENYLNNEIEIYYIIEVQNDIVGCGGINFEDDYTIGVISWDIIHPDFQGRYLGSKLLKHRLNELLLMESIRRIVVRTSQFTDRFYQKYGFVLLEVVKDFWADGIDLYKMEYKQ